MNNNSLRIAFFGSDHVSIASAEIIHAEIPITLAITLPDKPSGRKKLMSQTKFAQWADTNGIKVAKYDNYKDQILDELKEQEFDLFIVASYGKILPQELISLPKYKTLNIHPSLLPKWRGVLPVYETIIADEKETGVTVIQMDNKMDHGPIYMKTTKKFTKWDKRENIESTLARIGARSLLTHLHEYLNGTLTLTEQDHTSATFSKFISKTVGELFDTDSDEQKWLKYCACGNWPGVFYFDTSGKRVKVTQADFVNGKFIEQKIIPEGKSEITLQR